MKSIIRATFGKLSVNTISRITIGHIDIQKAVDSLRKHTGGSSNKRNKNKLRLVPIVDHYRKQKLQEDKDIIELITIMIYGDLL